MQHSQSQTSQAICSGPSTHTEQKPVPSRAALFQPNKPFALAQHTGAAGCMRRWVGHIAVRPIWLWHAVLLPVAGCVAASSRDGQQNWQRSACVRAGRSSCVKAVLSACIIQPCHRLSSSCKFGSSPGPARCSLWGSGASTVPCVQCAGPCCAHETLGNWVTHPAHTTLPPRSSPTPPPGSLHPAVCTRLNQSVKGQQGAQVGGPNPEILLHPRPVSGTH